jgi:cytochrome P450
MPTAAEAKQWQEQLYCAAAVPLPWWCVLVQVYNFNVPTFGKGVVYDVDQKVRTEQFRFFTEALKKDRLKKYVPMFAAEAEVSRRHEQNHEHPRPWWWHFLQPCCSQTHADAAAVSVRRKAGGPDGGSAAPFLPAAHTCVH